MAHRYMNENRHALTHYVDGTLCCDGDGNSTDDVCMNECETFFNFCMQPFGTVMQSVCPFGRYTTDVILGDDIMFQPNVELSPGIPNPMIFNGIEWPTVSAMYTSSVIPVNNKL